MHCTPFCKRIVHQKISNFLASDINCNRSQVFREGSGHWSYFTATRYSLMTACFCFPWKSHTKKGGSSVQWVCRVFRGESIRQQREIIFIVRSVAFNETDGYQKQNSKVTIFKALDLSRPLRNINFNIISLKLSLGGLLWTGF